MMAEERIAQSAAEAVGFREGEDASAWAQEEVEEYGPLPCSVRHADAGGQCERPAVLEVYGLSFCEAHGAECKAGALAELYHEASEWLGRLDNPHVSGPNPEALRVLRAGVAELNHLCLHFEQDEELLQRAYPYLEERVDSYTLEFDYDDPERSSVPVDAFREDRWAIHRLMRLSYAEGMTYLVEDLEERRQYLAAQAAFALAHFERRRRQS